MTSGLYYPDKFVRLTLQSMEEVIGTSGMKTIFARSRLAYLTNIPLTDSLQRAFDFSDFASLFATLREIMGDRGAHLLAVRAGRITFKQGMGFFNKGFDQDGVTSPDGTPPQSVGIQLNRLANFFNSISDQVCTLEPVSEPGAYLFSISVCPICTDQEAEQPICGFFEGLLSEAAWSFSGGIQHNVKELECMAAGAERCLFEIRPQVE
jgi:predicted hydrocarbon binding protein